jgi:hypothetical protein
MRRLLVAAAIALAGVGCRGDGDATLLVVVTASGSPPRVDSLTVTLNGPAGSWDNRYERADRSPITFPTTLTAELPARAAGDVTVEVRANDAAGTVASGQTGPSLVRPGDRLTIYVRLDCNDGPCGADGGVGPDGGGGIPVSGASCGNGRIDPGETCDKMIARGAPGACPPADCDDGIACTTDTRIGSDCTAECMHEEIVAAKFGDACCPAGKNDSNDGDCSAGCGNGIVEPGETCDTYIAAGAPGACPTAEDCKPPPLSCERGTLISKGTCSAVCLRQPVVTQSKNSDGCCPVGATSETDADCPVMCGNGIIESGERCDVGIAPLGAGSCPTGCDDGDPCTEEYLTNAGCQATCPAKEDRVQITAFISGDGCCPSGATHATDTDCAYRCGNGVVDPGEACDKAALGPGACPTSCGASPVSCLRPVLAGSADDCSARCTLEQVSECSRQPEAVPGKKGDGCCPPGCTSDTDLDCSSACGDGAIQRSSMYMETCDIGAQGPSDACPTSCPRSADCTEFRLVGAGTCHAKCVPIPVTALRAGDGCCPANIGGSFTLDPDCRVSCGDGVVDAPVEICDWGVSQGSCPETCPPPRGCTRFERRGDPDACNAACVAIAITGCSREPPDGCCPAGCTALTDADCPTICGDGVLETGETCDRAITAGMPDACPATCDDHDACTVDLASGSVAGCTRRCLHRPITGCIDGDGCCPVGCPTETDSDCRAVCGDGRVGGGETCDPPATCPAACPDDRDTCTVERLVGAASSCSVACVHAPITACSGSTADSCCPTGCTFATDTDC